MVAEDMTATVSAAIYYGVSRAERKRIAAQLQRLKALEIEAQPIRNRFKQALKKVEALPKPLQKAALEQVESEFAPMRELLTPRPIPIQLLACSECGKPTPQCSCGFDWSAT